MMKLSQQVRGPKSIKLVSKSKEGLKPEYKRWSAESSGEESVESFPKDGLIFHFQVMYHFPTLLPSAQEIKLSPVQLVPLKERHKGSTEGLTLRKRLRHRKWNSERRSIIQTKTEGQLKEIRALLLLNNSSYSISHINFSDYTKWSKAIYIQDCKSVLF